MEKNTSKMEVETGVSVDHRDTVVKVTRPQGRYKKRERGKLVSEYSFKHLEGILVKRGEGLGADDDFVGELNLSNTSDDHYFGEGSEGQTQSPEWWGHKYGFIPGGFLSVESRRKKSLITGNTQNGKGRTMFLKMIKRTSTSWSRRNPPLGNKDWESRIDQRKWLVATIRVRKSHLMIVKMKILLILILKRNKHAMTQLKQQKIDESRVKVKKLCKQLLGRLPGESLKLKQLKVLIDEHSSSVFSYFSSKREAVAYLKQKLEGSQKFCSEGKRVRLASKRS